ncbi:hypothetical protein Tco_1333880 [Tanacetum coccineum]
MAYFRSLHSHLQVLSKEDLKGTRIEHGFKRAFLSLFGQDAQIFAMQDESSKSENDTNADEADIRPIYYEEPMAEVQLTAECNVFATGQHHAEQPKFNNKGRVNQDAEQCQVKSHLLDPLLDNKTTEFLNQSLESENICLKITVA